MKDLDELITHMNQLKAYDSGLLVVYLLMAVEMLRDELKQLKVKQNA